MLSLSSTSFTPASLKRTPLVQGEYEQCTFTGVNLAGGNVMLFRFIDCTFTGCDLSNLKCSQTSFRDVRFTECKLSGVLFDQCNDFGFAAEFDRCVLDHASFRGMSLKKGLFTSCRMHGTDLSGADLTEALLERCDLADAVFSRTNLEKADLRTSYNIVMDPNDNRLKKARFSAAALPGLLSKHGIVIE